ncbi:MAG: hypothetical protein ACOC3Z_00365 [Nanoarchaeota archaeon]
MTNKLYFEQDKKNKCKEFADYLKKLSQDENPWICPYLRVMPKDVTIKRYNNEGPPYRYSKGELMCTERLRFNVSARCKGISKPITISKGCLEGFCDWPLKRKIVISIK